MFAVTHGRKYEGTTVVAVSEDRNMAISIAKSENDKLDTYSSDRIKVVSFARDRFYEIGIDYDDTDNDDRTFYDNWIDS